MSAEPLLLREAPEGGLRRLLGHPPLPHEHGAWAMLYVPLVLVLSALRPVPAMPAMLLLLATTGAFLGQNAAVLLLRGRGQASLPLWVGLYLGLFLLGGVPLLLVYERLWLIPMGALGVGLFLLHAALSLRPGGKRLVRARAMELLSVATMSLTAPAAYVVVRGGLDLHAALSWGACTLYFWSSVYYLKMLLDAARLRGRVDPQALSTARVPVLVYHLLLLAVVGLGLLAGEVGVYFLLAFAPVLARAVIGAIRLAPGAPNLKRVGLLECAYSLWFWIFAGLALRFVAGTGVLV